MQRIYTDGKPNLGEEIPETWKKPAKTINYRCPRRVITLINKIRSDADGQQQEPGKNEAGTVRLFVVDTSQPVEKAAIEDRVIDCMAEQSEDDGWNTSVKVLTLEHHMAASRGGFSSFFEPLYAVDKFKTGLIDGTLSGIQLFAKQVLPVIEAKKAGDEFSVSKVVRKDSPLLKKDVLKSSKKPIDDLRKAEDAVSTLYSLWDKNADPSLIDILRAIYSTNLFLVPEVLIPIAERLNRDEELEDDDGGGADKAIDAWESALQCSFSRFEEYVKYISDESRFGTHQGIKGLEFPRVMVILDDDEARGFLFSYDKLFGAKKLSVTDLKNIEEGKETGVDRTRRLFYVTCSRAENSLAIVAYTKDPQKVQQYATEQSWFEEDEIIQL